MDQLVDLIGFNVVVVAVPFCFCDKVEFTEGRPVTSQRLSSTWWRRQPHEELSSAHKEAIEGIHLNDAFLLRLVPPRT